MKIKYLISTIAVLVLLCVQSIQAEVKLLVPGMNNKVPSASLLANGQKIKTKVTKEGLVLNMPMTVPDAIASVIKVKVK